MRQIVISRRQYNQNETTYKPVFSFGRKILKTKMFSLILQKNCYYLTIYSKPKKKWNTSRKKVANNFKKKKRWQTINPRMSNWNLYVPKKLNPGPLTHNP